MFRKNEEVKRTGEACSSFNVIVTTAGIFILLSSMLDRLVLEDLSKSIILIKPNTCGILLVITIILVSLFNLALD